MFQTFEEFRNQFVTRQQFGEEEVDMEEAVIRNAYEVSQTQRMLREHTGESLSLQRRLAEAMEGINQQLAELIAALRGER